MRVVMRAIYVQLQNSAARRVIRYIIVIQPVVFATLAYFMLRGRPGVEVGSYIVVGSGLVSLWSTILFASAGDLERERWMGNFEYLFVAAVPLDIVMLGKIAANALIGCISMGVAYVYATEVLGARYTIHMPALFAVAYIGTVVAFLGVSLVLASAFTLSRGARMVVNGLEYPIYLVSGVMFPLTMLPHWAQYIGYAMPLYWARAALQAAALGSTTAFWPRLVILLTLGASYYIMGHVLFERVLWRLRALGTVGMH